MVEQSSSKPPRPKRVRSPSSLLRKAAKARAKYADKTREERSAPYQRRVAKATEKRPDKRRNRASRGDDFICTSVGEGPIKNDKDARRVRAERAARATDGAEKSTQNT